MWVQSLGQEKPLEKEIASHSSCLKNPMDRGARRLWFIGSINSWTQLSTPHSPCIYVYTHKHPHKYIYTYTHMYTCMCIYIYIFCFCCLVTKMCSILCNPMDCSLPGSSVYGISQASILEWVAISFFRGSSQTRDLSIPQLQSESESCSVTSNSL